MKKKSKKIRNPHAISAKARKSSGKMRNKNEKRKNGKNKQKEYLKDLE
jgi:hypothetical protein